MELYKVILRVAGVVLAVLLALTVLGFFIVEGPVAAVKNYLSKRKEDREEQALREYYKQQSLTMAGQEVVEVKKTSQKEVRGHRKMDNNNG